MITSNFKSLSYKSQDGGPVKLVVCEEPNLATGDLEQEEPEGRAGQGQEENEEGKMQQT